jgi:hypothetical protein
MVKHSHHIVVEVSGFDSRVGGAYRIKVRCADSRRFHLKEYESLSVDLYHVHLDNERTLAEAFSIARQSCKAAIGSGDERQKSALTKNCALLLGAKLETTLLRIVHNPSGFGEDQRRRILSASTASDRWLRVVKEAFASRHDLAVSHVPNRLPFTAQARYRELERLVKEQFNPLIELRNSLAHGQWHRTLNSSGTRVDSRRMAQLAKQSLWRITIQDNILHHMALIIYDLVFTRQAFERDFDTRWNDLHSAIRRLESSSAEKWEQMLRDRHERRWAYILRNRKDLGLRAAEHLHEIPQELRESFGL